MDFMAIRSTPETTSTLDESYVHHFDVSCTKCHQTYGLWGPRGPRPESNDQPRQEKEHWLTQFLADVCPFHKDSFPMPALEAD